MLGASLADAAGGLVPPDVAAGAAGAVMVTSGSTISPSSPRSSRTGSRAFRAGPPVIEGFLAQTGLTLQPQPP